MTDHPRPRGGVTLTLRAVAVSPEIQLGDVDANFDSIRSAVRTAADGGAQLIVLPELATCGYMFADRPEAEDAAVTRDDSRWAAIQEVLPTEAVVVIGYGEAAGRELYNTAAVLTCDRRLADYRKSHLWGPETQIFDRGTTAGMIVDAPFGRLGIAICYDNEFPEVPRRLARAGADVLAVPVNWPLVPRPSGEHPPELIQAMAAARSSRLPTVIADRHGEERGITWTAGTAIVDELGWVIARGADAARGATLALDAARDKSLPPYNDLFADRRPELY